MISTTRPPAAATTEGNSAAGYTSEDVPTTRATSAALAARVLEAEHRLYPHCLRLVAEGRIEIRGETAETPGIDPAARLVNPAP